MIIKDPDPVRSSGSIIIRNEVRDPYRSGSEWLNYCSASM
jgi:hypothetical protein